MLKFRTRLNVRTYEQILKENQLDQRSVIYSGDSVIKFKIAREKVNSDDWDFTRGA